MRFLRRNGTTTEDSPENGTAEVVPSIESHTKGYTPGKGRATPKRREAEGKRRGPVAPPPRTMREAMKRNRELKKSNPNLKAERRAQARERQRLMAEGDERYLPARDKGPVKAYVRDLVDSQRHLVGLFMPLAGVAFLGMYGGALLPYPAIQQFALLLCTLLLLAMAVDAVLLGRRITRQVRAKFPKETISGRSIGFYAFVRASYIRKLRMPKPRVKPGDTVS